MPYCRLLLIVALVAVLTPTLVWATVEKSRVGAAAGDMGAFNSALALYQVDVKSGCFPDTLMKLISDNEPGWSGPYMATIANDPWGYGYSYQSNGSDYTIALSHTRESGIDVNYCFSRGSVFQNHYSDWKHEWISERTPFLERNRKTIKGIIFSMLFALVFLTIYWSRKKAFVLGGLYGAIAAVALMTILIAGKIRMAFMFYIIPLYASALVTDAYLEPYAIGIFILQWWIIGGFISSDIARRHAAVR